MTKKWHFTNDKPIYFQIAEEIERRIVSGEYYPGEKLPGVRDLAIEAEVNHNTMQRALGELERTELICTKRTNGRFVTEDTQLISYRKNKLASEKTKDFLREMKKLGYNREEIAELIENFKED